MARVVPPTKKRNPQDTTLRNIRALKTRVQRLEDLMTVAISQINWFRARIKTLEKKSETVLKLHTRLTKKVAKG